MRVVVEPVSGDTKVHRAGGKLLLYIGKVTVDHHGNVTITPRRNISAAHMDILVHANDHLPRTREYWVESPQGWTTYVSVPVPKVRPLRKMDPHRVEIRRRLCPVDHPPGALAPERPCA